MSNSYKRKQTLKKEKQRKTIILSVLLLITVIIATIIVFNLIKKNSETNSSRVYTGGGQSVTLKDDSTFEASLAHDVNKTGTYSESSTDSVTTVTFTSGDSVANGSITNDVLTIPQEWNDEGHNHEMNLKLAY